LVVSRCRNGARAGAVTTAWSCARDGGKSWICQVVLAALLFVSSQANAQGLNPNYGADGQVHNRGVPDAVTLPQDDISFSSMNRQTCRQISLRPNARAFRRVNPSLRRPLQYSHSIRRSQNRQHQHWRRRRPQRACQIRSLNGAVRRRTPRRLCAATWHHRGCNDDAVSVQVF
jgi:hypothetical protein